MCLWRGRDEPAAAPRGQTIGLHRHGGDEIFQVFSGTVRFHIDGRNIDVGAGHFVVVPPSTVHGFKILSDDARMQFIGELEMGEWVTVLGEDGTSREVEIRSTMFPLAPPPGRGRGVRFHGDAATHGIHRPRVRRRTRRLIRFAATERTAMDLGISGRTVFFTGASKGMGRVAATMLAEEGCKVAVVARGKDAVDETVEEIRATGGTAMGVIADIACSMRSRGRWLRCEKLSGLL